MILATGPTGFAGNPARDLVSLRPARNCYNMLDVLMCWRLRKTLLLPQSSVWRTERGVCCQVKACLQHRKACALLAGSDTSVAGREVACHPSATCMGG
jgi:hypothetical protein